MPTAARSCITPGSEVSFLVLCIVLDAVLASAEYFLFSPRLITMVVTLL